MSRLAEKIHAAVRLDGRVELSAMDALAARDALDAMEQALRECLETVVASAAHAERVEAALAKLEADNG